MPWSQVIIHRLMVVVYLKEKTHWDYILLFNRKDFWHKARRQFEYALLKEGLVLEREMDRDSSNSYLKIYCPFQKLSLEAERLSVKIPLKVFLYLLFLVGPVYFLETVIV